MTWYGALNDIDEKNEFPVILRIWFQIIHIGAAKNNDISERKYRCQTKVYNNYNQNPWKTSL